MAAVLKTVDLNGFGGSNPSPSATSIDNQRSVESTPDFTSGNVKSGVSFYWKMIP